MDINRELGVTSIGHPERQVFARAVESPAGFAGHELSYMSRNVPYENKHLAPVAFVWAKRIGHRDRMAEMAFEHGNPTDRVTFAFHFSSYEDMMKKSISTSEGAYLWAKQFPGDREDMKLFIGGGEWAFKWARDIGDEDEMKDRIDIRFWKKKFEIEVEGNEAITFT